jgi:hypothetical protein
MNPPFYFASSTDSPQSPILSRTEGRKFLPEKLESSGFFQDYQEKMGTPLPKNFESPEY